MLVSLRLGCSQNVELGHEDDGWTVAVRYLGEHKLVLLTDALEIVLDY